MNGVRRVDLAAALQAPETIFRHPLEVLHSAELSDTDRMAILLNWKQSLEQLQSASDENMPNQTGTSDVSEMLAAVTNALADLGQEAPAAREPQFKRQETSHAGENEVRGARGRCDHVRRRLFSDADSADRRRGDR